MNFKYEIESCYDKRSYYKNLLEKTKKKNNLISKLIVFYLNKRIESLQRKIDELSEK